MKHQQRNFIKSLIYCRLMTKIVIVFFDKGSQTVRLNCFDHLNNNRNTVIVNNSPKEKARRFRETLFTSSIQNPRNLGFAGGCNVGIRRALVDGADAVFLLNQDAEIDSDSLKALEANPADIVAPIIRFKRGGKWVYDHGGKINWALGRTSHVELSDNQPHLGSASPKAKPAARGVMASQAQDEKFPPPEKAYAHSGGEQRTTINGPNIDYVSGCAMLIRRPVLENIGLFDERFFLYFEDADFCQRGIKAGFKVAVEPKAIVTHHIIEKEKKPFWQQREMLKSNYKFINKWLPVYRWPVAYCYWLVLSLWVYINNIYRALKDANT